MTDYLVTWKDGTRWHITADSAQEARNKARRKLAMGAPPERYAGVMKGTRHSIRSVELEKRA